ncbi:MAG TPA: hypothetical protein PL123_03115 [Bacteroidales bacterium]|nr:hypothetical protein [Bacteroidales bacterium]
MFLERNLEDIIAKYPELIEDGLILQGRQVTLYGRRMDLLFEDKFRRKLIVELKIGPIKDAHIGQVLSYEGMLLSGEDPSIRVMLIGNRVPPNIQRSLDHHGIAWREFTLSYLKEFLIKRNDEEFLNLFELDEPAIIKTVNKVDPVSQVRDSQAKRGFVIANVDDFVARIKSSESYSNFREILPMKIKNEEKAKAILSANLGKLAHNHLKEIVDLVDEPYPYIKNGKVVKGPWFGRLLKSNTVYVYNENVDKLNFWFNILTNNSMAVENRLELLLNEPNKIRGLNVGFITLMLYILDKENYSIWFEGQHEALALFYPDLEKYTGSSTQYSLYNELARKFIKMYNFCSTELDWIFSTGINNIEKISSVTIQGALTSNWTGLDQSKYTINQVFENQKAPDNIKEITFAFHKTLSEQLGMENLNWFARTHIFGISYFCNDQKTFLWVNIYQKFISLKYFTGNSSIEGIIKANWIKGNDNVGSEPYRIMDESSINRAVEFAIKAYKIAVNWKW